MGKHLPEPGPGLHAFSWTVSRVLWKVSLPIILVEATETLDHLIDSLFPARVGAMELGAFSVADSLMLLFLILPLAMVDAMQILTARRHGQRRPDLVGAMFNQSLLMVLLLGTAAVVALKTLSPIAAKWLVGSEAVGGAVDAYLQIDAFSIPLAGVTFAYSALLTSLGRTRALIPATILVVVADVILNYLFIFGAFGCPVLGMRGAAVGSIGAELAAVVFLTARRKMRPKGRGAWLTPPARRNTLCFENDLSEARWAARLPGREDGLGCTNLTSSVKGRAQ